MNKDRFAMEMAKKELEQTQFCAVVDNSSVGDIPSGSVNPHPHSNMHMNIEVDTGGHNHSCMLDHDLEPDSEVFADMKEPMTWQQEQDLIKWELDVFGGAT
ncbi:hypothetical protein K439DRAFT_1620933 [Ramaria rubella]|nr:hypothetical protein K439DRAFT_1620933 [Ramaria rubella]